MSKFTKYTFALLLILLTNTAYSQDQLTEKYLLFSKTNTTPPKKNTIEEKFKQLEIYNSQFDDWGRIPTPETVDVVDSVKYYYNNNYYKHIYIYNENGLLIVDNTYIWDGVVWQNDYITERTYIEDRLDNTFSRKRWDGEKWVNNNKITYQYTDDELQQFVTFEDWDSTKWMFDTEYVYKYDSNGKKLYESTETVEDLQENFWEYNSDSLLIKEESKMYHLRELDYHLINNYKYDEEKFLVEINFEKLDDGAYKKFARNSYTYYQSGTIETTILELVDSAETYHPMMKTSYYYEEDNFLDSSFFSTWNSVDSIWSNYAKEDNDFDINGNEIYKCVYYWNMVNSSWLASNRATFEYNVNGDYVSKFYEVYDSTGWVNNKKYNYEYNSKGYLNSTSCQKWEDNTWVPLNGFFAIKKHEMSSNTIALYCNAIEKVFYSQITDVTDAVTTIQHYTLEQNYPNPFNPNTTIKYSIPVVKVGQTRSKHVTLSVYDLLGKRIKTLVNEAQSAGNYSVNFNATNLPSGIYFYKLETGSFVSTKKMILLK